MILSKKRVATIDAINDRFGSPATITRAQIATAVSEKVIAAWPYWLTDDLTMKVDRGVWTVPQPDNFRLVEKGEKVTEILAKRRLVAAGADVPVFTKPKVEKPAKAPKAPKPEKVAKPAKEPKAPNAKKPAATPPIGTPSEVVTAPKATKKASKKAAAAVTVIPTEVASETVSTTA